MSPLSNTGPRWSARPIRQGLVAGLLALTLAGCTSQTPATPASSATAPATAPKTASGSPQAPAASPSPTVRPAQPAASPAASPARAATTGKVVYVLDYAFVPAWLDPQENPALLSPYPIQYALHDAVVKHLPGQPLAPSLAESYEVAPDFKSATFKLRPGIAFHNGDPVTVEDVRFTFENYRGTNAKALKDEVERIETPDDRTIRFVFKRPFLDFMLLYGSPASGAAWVVPKKYYEQVGPDGFKQKPIGAGPYKFVRQVSGSEFEFEAVPDYWRKAPAVRTLVLKGITEAATRVAAFQTGEADFIHAIPGPLLETVQKDPKLRTVPVLAAPAWLEMPGYEKPDSPFRDVRIRQAVSLALNRQALSDAESAGYSVPLGNWIPENWPGAITWPKFPHDVARAKQLMAEAGYPSGFDAGDITPLPPYNSLAERIATQLRDIEIRVRVNSMERAAFAAKLTEGPNALTGLILNISGSPGDAANRVRTYAICPPKGSTSRTCDPKIDDPYTRYEASPDPKEREQLLNGLQTYMLENHIFIPVYRLAVLNGLGGRIANKPEEVMAAIPQFTFVGPWEDVRLAE